MKRNGVRAGGIWMRALALVLIGLAVMGPATSNRVAAHQRLDVETLDLAAMTLRPEDLAKAGLEGYGADLGQYMTPEQQVADLIAAVGGDSDEVSEALIDEAGLQGSYWMRIGLPVDPGDFDSVATRAVIVTLYAFEDEAGAEDGYDFLMADPDPYEEGDVEFTPVDADVSVGDTSDLVSFETEDSDTGDPIQSLNLFFRSGRIIADVVLLDVLREDERTDDPETEEIEALGELLLDRIEAGLEGEVPGLSSQIVRFADEDAGVATWLDIYTMVDGVTIRRFTDGDEEIEDRAERYEDAGITDVYGVEQSAVEGDEASAADPYYSARIYQFESESAADDWLDEHALDAIADDPSLTAFDDITRIDPMGDGVVAATYSAELDGIAFHGRIVAVRSGDLVVVMRMESGGGINLDTLLEVVEVQLDCLDAGACDGPVAPPEGFVS